MVSKEYIAGFLDADGSIALSSKSAKCEWARTPEISFFNCDRGILDAIQKQYNAGKVKANKPTSKNHNVSYSLHVGGNAAIVLMSDVLPYMLHEKKRQRARLIVENYKSCTPRNGKYNKAMIAKKMKLIEDVMGIQMRGKGAY